MAPEEKYLSSLICNILLSVVKFSCLNRNEIFTSRKKKTEKNPKKTEVILFDQHEPKREETYLFT